MCGCPVIGQGVPDVEWRNMRPDSLSTLGEEDRSPVGRRKSVSCGHDADATNRSRVR
jgi:hypothetical protein